MVCYWSMKSHDIYFMCRNKTSFSKSWTCPSTRRGFWVLTFRCKYLFAAPFMEAFSRRRMKETWTWVSQPTAANSRHPHPPCVVFGWQNTSQFPKSHVFSLEICNPIAFILTHVALSCWHGRRTNPFDCRLCATSCPQEAEEKMLPAMNSAQIKRSSSQHCTSY